MDRFDDLYVGMKVRIRTGSMQKDVIPWNSRDMSKYQGTVMTIRRIDNGYCQMFEDEHDKESMHQHGWYWAPCWFDPADDESEADAVADDSVIASLFA